MDGLTNSFLSSIWSHNNNTSEKIYSEVELDPPGIIPNGEEAIVSSSLLVTNGGMKLNAASSLFPVTNLVEGGNGCQLTNLPLPPLSGAELLSSNLTTWAPSSLANSDVSSFKDLGEFNYPTPNSFDVQHPESFDPSVFHTQPKGLNGMNGLNLTSFTSGSEVSFIQTLALQANTQLTPGSHASPAHATRVTTTTNAGLDGTFKPRARARRGHATDPHSIAERLRREKISERMKNLQELVPNSNKTDKASMLDEIIDYVKFLQLQVKVLSMSRLGATEAVVPLLTESQPEGSTGVLHLPSVSVGSTANVSLDGTAELQDSAAFEREVIQLMESNVTSAMQYLQNKGLCLMPIALASAISTQKGTHMSAIPTARHQNSDSSLCNDFKE
ncbi:uncharacterized protein LOC144560750 isoform X1 [Carex rostrata]